MVLLKRTWAVMVVLSWGSAAIAGSSCLPPAPPWMPTNADDVRAYALADAAMQSETRSISSLSMNIE